MALKPNVKKIPGKANVGEGIQKKIGPWPLWMYAVVGSGAFLAYRLLSGGGSSSPDTTTGLDVVTPGGDATGGIAGPKGDTGAPGAKGDKGDKGAKGDPGGTGSTTDSTVRKHLRSVINATLKNKHGSLSAARINHILDNAIAHHMTDAQVRQRVRDALKNKSNGGGGATAGGNAPNNTAPTISSQQMTAIGHAPPNATPVKRLTAAQVGQNRANSKLAVTQTSGHRVMPIIPKIPPQPPMRAMSGKVKRVAS